MDSLKELIECLVFMGTMKNKIGIVTNEEYNLIKKVIIDKILNKKEEK